MLFGGWGDWDAARALGRRTVCVGAALGHRRRRGAAPIFDGRTVTCARGASGVADLGVRDGRDARVREAHARDVWLARAAEALELPPARARSSDKTLALVGLGGIGTEIAKRALPFGMRVRAVRRTDAPSPVEGVEIVTRLRRAPARRRPPRARGARQPPRRSTSSTPPRSTAVKPGVHLVNIARGSLVDQDALRVALDDGRVAMATLDTVDPEPLPDGHWMYEHPKVRLSAHVSWGTTEHFTGAIAIFVENLAPLRRRASRCASSSISTRATECRCVGSAVRRRRHRFRVPRPRARAARRRVRRASRSSGAMPSAPRAAPSGSGVAARVHVARRRARAARRRRGHDRRRRRATHAALAIEACARGQARDLREAVRARRGGSGRDAGRGRRGGCRRISSATSSAGRPTARSSARAIADGRIGEPRLASLVQSSPLVADPEATAARLVVRRGAGRRLARRVGFAHRRPGARVARRVRVGERDAADRVARAPASPTTRSRSAFRLRSGVEVVHAADGRGVGPDVAASPWSPAPTARSWIDGDGAWIADRDGPRLLDVPADLASAAAPPRATIRVTASRTSSSVPYTRLCEACARRSKARRCPTRVAVPTFADGLARCRCSTRSASAAAGGALAERRDVHAAESA